MIKDDDIFTTQYINFDDFYIFNDKLKEMKRGETNMRSVNITYFEAILERINKLVKAINDVNLLNYEVSLITDSYRINELDDCALNNKNFVKMEDIAARNDLVYVSIKSNKMPNVKVDKISNMFNLTNFYRFSMYDIDFNLNNYFKLMHDVNRLYGLYMVASELNDLFKNRLDCKIELYEDYEKKIVKHLNDINDVNTYLDVWFNDFNRSIKKFVDKDMMYELVNKNINKELDVLKPLVDDVRPVELINKRHGVLYKLRVCLNIIDDVYGSTDNHIYAHYGLMVRNNINTGGYGGRHE